MTNDPEALQELISALGEKLSESQKRIDEQDQQLSDSHSVIEELTEQVKLLKTLYFAKKSEKQRKSEREEQQYSLFDEAELVAKQEDSEVLKGSEAAEDITVKAYARKKGRKSIPEDFPREEIIHDIPEEDKICQCGCRLTKIGEVISEKLNIIPHKITVKRYICGRVIKTFTQKFGTLVFSEV